MGMGSEEWNVDELLFSLGLEDLVSYPRLLRLNETRELSPSVYDTSNSPCPLLLSKLLTSDVSDGPAVMDPTLVTNENWKRGQRREARCVDCQCSE